MLSAQGTGRTGQGQLPFCSFLFSHLPPSNNYCGPRRNQPAPKHVYTQTKAKSPVEPSLTVVLYPNSSVEIMFMFLTKQDFSLAAYSFTAPTVPGVVQGGLNVHLSTERHLTVGSELRAHFHSADPKLYRTRWSPNCHCVSLPLTESPCCVALLIIQKLQEHKTLNDIHQKC